MKLGLNMHLPKEDSSGGHEIVDFSFNLNLEPVFSNSSKPEDSPEKSNLSLCPECLQHGEHSYIKPFQLNFGEAIYLCPVQSCSYPMKENNLIESFVVKSDVSELPVNTFVKPAKKSRNLSSYSMFFDEFDPDVEFPEFTRVAESLRTANLTFSQSSEAIVCGTNLENNHWNKMASASLETKMESVASERNDVMENVERVSSHVQDITTSAKLSTVSESRICTLSKFEAENNEVNVNIGKGSPFPEGLSVTGTSPSLSTTGSINTTSTDCQKYNMDTNFVMDVDPSQEEPVADLLDNASINELHKKDDATPVVEVSGVEDYSGDIPVEPSIQKLSRPPVFCKMIQWTNEDNSCWLDSIMQVLVNSVNIRVLLNVLEAGVKSLLKSLIGAYDKCQIAFHERISGSSHAQRNCMDDLNRSMDRIRNRLLKVLKKKLAFKSGEFQSLLEMLPLVLKSDPLAENLFKTHLLWDFQCEKCGHRRARRSNEHMVSLPNTMPDFHPLNAQFHRLCYECKSPSGVTSISMEKLPLCLMFHFQRGLPHSNLSVLDFAVHGHLYSVFAVVQYTLNPFKHFVTWVKDTKTNKWLCCNDLENSICTWQLKQPKLPPSEIHMVFWERQLYCNPLDAELKDVSTVLNEETAAFGEEIPLELFFAHEEDETIVIPEDEQVQSSNESLHCSPRNCIHSATKPCCSAPKSEQYKQHHSVTPSGGQNSTQSTSLPAMSSPETQSNAKSIHGELAISPSCVSSAASTSFQFSPSMLANGGMTVCPSADGRQTIHLVAPANTCSIFIVTNDNKNQQPIYIGSPNSTTSVSNRSTPCSFIDNPHRDSTVSQGIHGSANHKGEKHVLSSHRPKHQYRLSGYSKGTSSNRFSPMKVSKPGSKSSNNNVDAQSEYSYNSKRDSETLSEVSELSDLLPDFEFETSSRRSSGMTSSTSLPNSNRTTPTNGLKRS